MSGNSGRCPTYCPGTVKAIHLVVDAVDVADIPVMIIVGHVEGRRAARGSDVALPLRGAPDGAPVLLEEDAATVTKLLAVRLVPKGLKIVFCLFVGYEENQTQELAVDASRGRHARRQKSHMPVRRYVSR